MPDSVAAKDRGNQNGACCTTRARSGAIHPDYAVQICSFLVSAHFLERTGKPESPENSFLESTKFLEIRKSTVQDTQHRLVQR